MAVQWTRLRYMEGGDHVNVEQSHINTKVEGVLCVGRPIRFKLVSDSDVTPEWLKLHLVPGIASFYDINAIVLVLACSTIVMGKS